MKRIGSHNRAVIHQMIKKCKIGELLHANRRDLGYIDLLVWYWFTSVKLGFPDMVAVSITWIFIQRVEMGMRSF